MRVGVIVILDDNLDAKFDELCKMGMNSCQLVSWDEKNLTDEVADKINAATKKYNVTITAFWCGWPGKVVWDLYEGQLTLGLVPMTYRYERFKVLLAGAEFAHKIGVTDLVTHIGYMPENPLDPTYQEIVLLIRELAEKCQENGQRFLFETGQETPVTLRRAIEDIGTGNVGVNLDPANLLMYGKGNPVDALDVFGEYVWGIHGKDGEYPVDGKNLGDEKPLGEGRVNYPSFIAKLKAIGYDGDITIEREIEGEEQKKDIEMAKKMLEDLINK